MQMIGTAKRYLEALLEPKFLSYVIIFVAALLLGGILYALVVASPRELQAFIIQHNLYQSLTEVIVTAISYIFGAFSIVYMYSALKKKTEESLKMAGLSVLLLLITFLMLSYLYYLKIYAR